jgi:hypothetical protein
VYVAAALPGYQDELLVIVDISDPANPREVSRWAPPGQHIAAGEKPEEGIQLHGPPMRDGNRLYLDYGSAGMHILDISDITRPRPVGSLDFTGPFTGGIPVHTIIALMYLTYFNAGLRVFDISNARLPREVGYFIPPDPVKRYGPVPTRLVEQTEDVLVDRRGYVYVTNKNQGLWILRYTGRSPPPLTEHEPQRHRGTESFKISPCL